MSTEKFYYDNKIVRYFMIATLIWGGVGMLVGVLIAFQLVYPSLNFGMAETTYGRIRPLHTNAAIFAFVGNLIFMGVYHSLQRLCKARMFNDTLSWLHFWGWQLIIVLAAITLPLGLTSSKEYAELEWPIDILITLVWVIFGINMFGTIIKRRVRHMYVAIWFYIATFVTIAILHIVNSAALPLDLFKSYSAYSGVQDALVQWWYGHNAVAFFLTTPFLGLMYYYLPKAANRPVYSYRLSIIHFWSLIFIYIWAGPHHLLYTALPGWAQSLGVVFSIMLLAPSWGGMVNGLLTLKGVWYKLTQQAELKFFVIALTSYGMVTFEGPMLSLKTVNALAHYTDWIPAHVHIGTLGWNGFLTFGILYWLVPKLFRTELYSQKLANLHFWIGTFGIVLYSASLYWAGVTQGLMWQQFTDEGTLQYGNFMDTVLQIIPMYLIRAIGGTIYLLGFFLMVFNLIKTMNKGSFVNNEADEAPALSADYEEKGLTGYLKHRILERKPMVFMVLSIVVISIGGLVEFLPTALVKSNIPQIESVQPYKPLELHGRDIYIAEGCNACHSQMIRPLRFETERYGEYSKAGEFVYDFPFLWGSKRTGPDLHRLGGKYPNLWHYKHMIEPESTSPGSIMPPYPWLAERMIDTTKTPRMISIMQTLGVPYPEGYDEIANQDLMAQATEITDDLALSGVEIEPTAQLVALISYMQRLGTDISREVETVETEDEPITGLD